MVRLVGAILLVVALFVSGVARADQPGPVTALVLDQSCADVEFGGSGSYYTVGVDDPTFDPMYAQLLVAYIHGYTVTVGATSGSACGNTRITSMYIGTEH